MKKIFAIALALVMVLSMASAMAYCVTDINWACATDVCENGTGSVKLIPYVKGNGCGTFNSFTVPENCAGAVNGDKVYFAIKVTVDADPNMEWWNAATLTATVKGMKYWSIGTTKMTGNLPAGFVNMVKAVNDDGEFKAGEYYLTYTPAKGWFVVKAADWEADATNLFSATVDEAAKAKICVKLASKNSFNNATINGYKVELLNDGVNILQISKKNEKFVQVETDEDDKVVAFKVNVGDGWETIKTYNVGKTAFYATSNNTYNWTCDELGKFLKEVMDAFKLDFGTCVTKKAVKANFGWDNTSESCYQWSANAISVVDPSCTIEIPKTGDVSVVAYAVMALVAAAGAMGLKK